MPRATSRLLPRIAILLLAILLIPPKPATALDLQEMRRDGDLVAQALALGGGGDWEAAATLVAQSHPVVQDIVLWRKLRAGEGSVDEYAAYVARRPEWPGRV